MDNLFPIYEFKFTMVENLFQPKNCMKIAEKENINNIYEQIDPISR